MTGQLYEESRTTMAAVALFRQASTSAVYHATSALRVFAAGGACIGFVLASSACAAPAADPSPVLPPAKIPNPVLPTAPVEQPSIEHDSTSAMSVLTANNGGAGFELGVASFASAHACPVTTRIRIDASSSNAGLSRAAAEAAIATKMSIRATITACAADGTPLTNSIWMVR